MAIHMCQFTLIGIQNALAFNYENIYDSGGHEKSRKKLTTFFYAHTYFYTNAMLAKLLID